MRSFLYCCAAALLTASQAEAQLNKIWVKHHDGAGHSDDTAWDVVVDPTGNAVVTGMAINALGVTEMFTAKYNSNGNKLWAKTNAGTGGGPDYGWVVRLDPSGNVIVAGEVLDSATGYDLVTLKYSPQGNLLWSQHYDGPGSGDDGVFFGRGLGVDALGNVVVGAISTGAGTGYDWLVLKYSAGGALLWEDTIASPGNDFCWDLQVDPAGNIYAGGEVTGDIHVIKYDANGSILWQNAYDGPAGGSDLLYRLDVDSSGNVAVAGMSPGIGTGEDYVTLAYDANGNQLFEQLYDGPASLGDLAFAVAISDSGLVATTGFSTDSAYDSKAATVLYDLNGNLLWAQHYDGDSYYYGGTEGGGAQFDADGDLFVLAWGWSGPESAHDAYLLKYSPAGVLLNEVVHDGAVHGDDAPFSLAQDGQGNVYLAGYSQRGKRHLDGMLVKLGPGTPEGGGSPGQLPEEDDVLATFSASAATARLPAAPFRPDRERRLPFGLHSSAR